MKGMIPCRTSTWRIVIVLKPSEMKPSQRPIFDASFVKCKVQNRYCQNYVQGAKQMKAAFERNKSQNDKNSKTKRGNKWPEKQRLKSNIRNGKGDRRSIKGGVSPQNPSRKFHALLNYPNSLNIPKRLRSGASNGILLHIDLIFVSFVPPFSER